MYIRIKYHNKNIDKVSLHDKSDWIDLRAAETVEIKAGEHKLINLGVSMQIPYGYEANIVPRSSTFKNYGLLQTNHFGVVDNTYCGDNDVWFWSVYATRDTIVNENDRVCQFRINQKQPSFYFEEVEMMNNDNRGGHGSTGTN